MLWPGSQRSSPSVPILVLATVLLRFSPISRWTSWSCLWRMNWFRTSVVRPTAMQSTASERNKCICPLCWLPNKWCVEIARTTRLSLQATTITLPFWRISLFHWGKWSDLTLQSGKGPGCNVNCYHLPLFFPHGVTDIGFMNTGHTTIQSYRNCPWITCIHNLTGHPAENSVR